MTRFSFYNFQITKKSFQFIVYLINNFFIHIFERLQNENMVAHEIHVEELMKYSSLVLNFATVLLPRYLKVIA